MSKSLKNYPDPNLVIDKYGADATRWGDDIIKKHFQLTECPKNVSCQLSCSTWRQSSFS